MAGKAGYEGQALVTRHSQLATRHSPPPLVNFLQSLPAIVSQFDAAGIRYALIGGLAMAARGVQRATLDADFILLLDDLERADAILNSLGYRREFHSENVSHYVAPDPALGRIDLLHAFRRPALGMLDRAERLELLPGLPVPVVAIEDLVGLKIQAAANDPARHRSDWNDIEQLVEHAGRNRIALDWELLADYLALFDLPHKLPALRQLHGPAHSS